MTSRSKSIKDIVEQQYSGFVLSHDGNHTTPFVAQQVTQWHSKGVKPVYRYTLEDGSYVDCTEDHNFLLKKTLKMKPIDSIYESNLELYSIKEQ